MDSPTRKPPEGARPRPWMIAAWPGMGSVAVLAAGYLIRELSMEEEGELPTRGHFDIHQVAVKDGLVQPVRMPHGHFFRWRNPGAGRDLVVFLAEAQPAQGVWSYANELLDAAAARGIERVVTFASMASTLHPAANPKVTGVATDPGMLVDLRHAEVSLLEEGQVGGLNGVVLGAAADRSLPGLGLLGEIPFFAAEFPNPKAARAILSVFGVLSGIEISLSELDRHVTAMDRVLLTAYERLREHSEAQGGGPPPPESPGTDDELAGPAPEEDNGQDPRLDFLAREEIERLFVAARSDPSRVMELKNHLDRLGVFPRYEDRFLDLFRKAE